MSKAAGVNAPVDTLYSRAATEFAQWEVVKDIVDECMALMLNYRQSGHPGGSFSKAHTFLATLLSGAMRFDLLRPWLTYADRFVLSAGHTVPLLYGSLAVLNEIARIRAAAGEARFVFPDGGRWALTHEDLVGLRHRPGAFRQPHRPGHRRDAHRTRDEKRWQCVQPGRCSGGGDHAVDAPRYGSGKRRHRARLPSRTSARTPGSSKPPSMRATSPAISSISASPMPREVTDGDPRRMPLGL